MEKRRGSCVNIFLYIGVVVMVWSRSYVRTYLRYVMYLVTPTRRYRCFFVLFIMYLMVMKEGKVG